MTEKEREKKLYEFSPLSEERKSKRNCNCDAIVEASRSAEDEENRLNERNIDNMHRS